MGRYRTFSGLSYVEFLNTQSQENICESASRESDIVDLAPAEGS